MLTTVLADYGAVLADLDGTLIDSEVPVRKAWSAFARRHRLDPDVVMRAARGRPAWETARELAPDHPEEPSLLEQAELDPGGVVALPGAAALLASPLKLAIVTSCSRRLAAVRLAAAGLPEPATLVCADELRHGKPDPEGYRLGAQRLATAPASCVVLEDAPVGIEAGKAAGMTVIALRTTNDDAVLATAGADVIVNDLRALAIPPPAET